LFYKWNTFKKQTMKNIIQIIFGLALLVGAFILGTSWKTDDTKLVHNVSSNTEATTENNETSGADIITANAAINSRKDLNAEEKATILLFEEAAPSVTFITTSNFQRDYFTMNVTEIPRGNGSGFVWDKKGHIVTNYHVIKNADRAQVTLADRSTWNASLVGTAPEKDLAILRIDAPAEVLHPIPVGASDNLLVGQSVYAIGNPFGLDHTLTTGIISALGREIDSQTGAPIRDAIQTDAAINPGNSGGPLLNSSGELIGVNTAIFSPSGAYAGIGFSIPVDVVRTVVPDLITYGKIIRPTLGIQIASARLTAQLGVTGLLIMNVTEGGSAETAGIQPTYRNQYGQIVLGDVIVAINNESIKSKSDLQLITEKYKPNDQVTVSVLRNNAIVDLPLILGTAQ